MKNILLFIIFCILFISGIVLVCVGHNIEDTEGKCYDNRNSVINGATCIVYTPDIIKTIGCYCICDSITVAILGIFFLQDKKVIIQ